MKPKSFTSESYPVSERADAWRDALEKLGLRPIKTDKENWFLGSISEAESPQGFKFATVTSSPLGFGTVARYGRSLWMALLLDGQARIVDPDSQTPLRVGDLAFGAGGLEGEIIFQTNFRLLWINVPATALSSRLLGLAPQKAAHIPVQSGIARVFTGLLRSLADCIEELGNEQLHPIESAVTEFLVATLIGSTPAKSDVSAGHGAILNRIYQTIENKLGDPEFSLSELADEHGVTPRYLQKLLESADETFSHYVRIRRLDRCRSDLANPLYDRLSVSEICFRWGFNDAAHFSRAFRDHYGLSPREYRTSLKTRPPEVSHLPTRGRPVTVTALDRPTGLQSASVVNLKTWTPSKSSSKARPVAAAGSHYVPATERTVHWGYLSHRLPPVLEVKSGDIAIIETLTHHASDDHERMIAGDSGAERVFHWTKTSKALDRRGAGPMDASIFGRGAGEGFGDQICTGPIYVKEAERGDILEVRILDIDVRPSANPDFSGRAFGSNVATWWGYHFEDLVTEPRSREVVTIYEIDTHGADPHAQAIYNYRWTPQTDPFGVVHTQIDYPGVPVDPTTIKKNFDVLKRVRIPLRPHFGFLALAPRESADPLDSIPPGYFGGNLDNWRAGKGSSIYLYVTVPGGLFSVGDPHAAQGDAQLGGTAIECSLTGHFQFILHRKKDGLEPAFRDFSYPVIETETEWVFHAFSQPNFLSALGPDAQSEVYRRSSLDAAMRDAFRKARRFLMHAKGLSEDEAISVLSAAADFGVTQVVNGNWGVHAIIPKKLFR